MHALDMRVNGRQGGIADISKGRDRRLAGSAAVGAFIG